VYATEAMVVRIRSPRKVRLTDAMCTTCMMKEGTRPDKLHADKAYNSSANRASLRRRHIRPRLARKGIESKERLGHIEVAHAWFNHFRGLLIGWAKKAPNYLALLQPAGVRSLYRKVHHARLPSG
jgi:hypothetical protein